MCMANDGATFETLVPSHRRRPLVRELVARQRDLAAILADLVRTDEVQAGEANGVDNCERAQQSVDRVQTQSLEQKMLERIERIESAIGRLDDDTYGTCTCCGEPIEKARLEALPEVIFCVACKSDESLPSRWR